MNPTQRIPIADPAAEYRELAAEIDAAVGRVLASGRYLPATDEAARTVLSLPIFPHLGADRARRVCEALRANA